MPEALNTLEAMRPSGGVASTRRCLTCHGVGEVIARSRSVGGGCINDDWDTCPDCHGSGTVRVEAPKAQTPTSRHVAISLALYDALAAALAERRAGRFLADARLEVARAALLAHGKSPEDVAGMEGAIEQGWRDARAPRLPVGVTALDLEAEQRR